VPPQAGKMLFGLHSTHRECATAQSSWSQQRALGCLISSIQSISQQRNPASVSTVPSLQAPPLQRGTQCSGLQLADICCLGASPEAFQPALPQKPECQFAMQLRAENLRSSHSKKQYKLGPKNRGLNSLRRLSEPEWTTSTAATKQANLMTAVPALLKLQRAL